MVKVEVDSISYNKVLKDLSRYDKEAGKAIDKAIDNIGLFIETTAKKRLQGKLGSARHWITGRLASSIHRESPTKNSYEATKANEPEDSNFNQPLKDGEILVGTNVNYASKIEFMYDRFLTFASELAKTKIAGEFKKQFDKIK